MVAPDRIELPLSRCKRDSLPLQQGASTIYFVSLWFPVPQPALRLIPAYSIGYGQSQDITGYQPRYSIMIPYFQFNVKENIS